MVPDVLMMALGVMVIKENQRFFAPLGDIGKAIPDTLGIFCGFWHMPYNPLFHVPMLINKLLVKCECYHNIWYSIP